MLELRFGDNDRLRPMRRTSVPGEHRGTSSTGQAANNEAADTLLDFTDYREGWGLGGLIIICGERGGDLTF